MTRKWKEFSWLTARERRLSTWSGFPPSSTRETATRESPGESDADSLHHAIFRAGDGNRWHPDPGNRLATPGYGERNRDSDRLAQLSERKAVCILPPEGLARHMDGDGQRSQGDARAAFPIA